MDETVELNEDLPQSELLTRAMHFARKAFFKTIEDAGEDGAYYGFDFRGRGYGDDFAEVMVTASLSDYAQHEGGKKEVD